MKSSNVSLVFSRVIVLSLSFCLLCVQTLNATTVPAKSVAAAEIAVDGPRENGEKAFVLVNGEKAFTGRTFISNGIVSTTDTSSATISLGKLGRIELAPSSTLTLSFSDGRIVGDLAKGRLNISNSDGVAVAINTPSESITNEGTSASRFTVSVAGEQTGLAVANGNVRSNGSAVALQDDDDDDDDHWKAWVWVGIIGGAVATFFIVRALDDEDSASPVR